MLLLNKTWKLKTSVIGRRNDEAIYLYNHEIASLLLAMTSTSDIHLFFQ